MSSARRRDRTCAVLVLGAALSACGAPTVDTDVALRPPPPPVVPASPVWPAAGAPLNPPTLVAHAALEGRIVAVDAGHGAPGNLGATSWRCRREADVVLPLAEALADDLEAAGLRVVRLRPPGSAPTYTERLAAVREAGAELLISVHADVRFPAREAVIDGGCRSLISEGQPGFSVLFSDEGEPVLATQRQALAGAMAASLRRTGLPAYDGSDYTGIYAETAAGVFVDRHAPRQRIRFLRAPAVPSVIVEVGHLLDPEEEARLHEERVREQIGRGMAVGVVEWMREVGGGGSTGARRTP